MYSLLKKYMIIGYARIHPELDAFTGCCNEHSPDGVWLWYEVQRCLSHRHFVYRRVLATAKVAVTQQLLTPTVPCRHGKRFDSNATNERVRNFLGREREEKRERVSVKLKGKEEEEERASLNRGGPSHVRDGCDSRRSPNAADQTSSLTPQ